MEKDYFIFLDDYDFDRIRIFGFTKRGNVKDIHRDVMMPNGEKEKEFVEIESMNEAFTYAVQDIKDRWKFYLERYKSKIRS